LCERFFPDASDGDLDATRHALEVIHVHGTLPAVPSKLFEYDFHGSDKDWLAWLPTATKQIRVVMDDIDADTLQRSQDAVRQASVLCFLGFAYATDNLNRLEMARRLRKSPPNMYGSAWGLTDGEKEWVQGRLPGIRLAGKQNNCLSTLESFHIFRD
jgi:hypothetical protein